jgi:hypothetical protein
MKVGHDAWRVINEQVRTRRATQFRGTAADFEKRPIGR